MLAVLVLPYLNPELAQRTRETWCFDPEVRFLAIDNRGQDKTLSGAWNIGVRQVLTEGHDWFIMLSTAITFGPNGGAELLEALRSPEHQPMRDEEHPPTDKAARWIVGGLEMGWKYNAIRRDALEFVGEFDEGFAPAYYEDTDWIRRAKTSGLGDLWVDGHLHVEVGFETLGDGHSLKSGLVQVDFAAARSHYHEKWGGDAPVETFPTPFDRPGVDHRWLWADELAAREAV